MFIPEYTITSNSLKNIANIEYGKAIIDHTPILQNWQRQLEKEARIKTITAGLAMIGKYVKQEKVKKFIDGISKDAPLEAVNLNNTLDLSDEMTVSHEPDEENLKSLHANLSKGILSPAKTGVYRSKKLENNTNPEEILADIVVLFDWCNSLDAKESHPVITAAILKARLEIIQPFEELNCLVADLESLLLLKTAGYTMNGYISLGDYYNRTKGAYEHNLYSISQNDPEFTSWIEYYTEAFASEVLNIKEKILLLARDTKLAKASGRIKLTQRQERIIEYLQDYGLLQNRDFTRVFPGVSEDSILRDLKALVNEEIVVKTGSTKSSRYELK